MVDTSKSLIEVGTSGSWIMKDVFFAIALTMLFSIGVGVLFVRTVLEMLQILFYRGKQDQQKAKPAPKELGG